VVVVIVESCSVVLIAVLCDSDSDSATAVVCLDHEAVEVDDAPIAGDGGCADGGRRIFPVISPGEEVIALVMPTSDGWSTISGVCSDRLDPGWWVVDKCCVLELPKKYIKAVGVVRFFWFRLCW
jgi:hypothetical protein